MKHAIVAMAVLVGALMSLPAFGAEATFERTLTVNGEVELSVTTGAGSIHLSQGAAGEVHIVGHVHSGWGVDEEQVREVAAHPPIEQTGNIVRVGTRQSNLHNIGIDYEIEAPADTFLEASSGSGRIEDDGVGTDARLNTGSGSIHATGLRNAFSVATGSGSIYAEQTGRGDVHAKTGSGSIELHNLDGTVRAGTGSGSVKAWGTVSGPWRIDTGSGSVEIWTGNSAFTLDAGCGSGGIHSDRELTSEIKETKHHLRGTVNGGGPMVSIHTGSGGIRLH